MFALLTNNFCSFRLHDKPVGSKEEEGDAANSQMSASELRKMRNKQRKAQLKAEKEKEKENEKGGGGKKGGEKKDAEAKSEFAEVVDVAKLEKTETPLDDVMRFLAPYKLFGRHLLEAHFLAFEVYFRKGKILLQLQSLKRAFRAIDGSAKKASQNRQQYPRLLRQCCLFLSTLLTRRETLPEAMRHLLSSELSQTPLVAVFGLSAKGVGGDQVVDTSLSQLPSTEDFLAKHLPADSSSFTVRVEHMKVKHYLDTVSLEEANSNQSNPGTKQLKAASAFTESMIAALVAQADALVDLTLDGALALYGAVKSGSFGQVTPPTLEALRASLHRLYPYASRFMLERELAELEAELRDSDYFTADTEAGEGGGLKEKEPLSAQGSNNSCEA